VIQNNPLSLDEIQGALGTKRLGTRFHYFQEIDSTNSYARRLADAGVPEGEVVIAERQSEGRGRLGRSWVSPPFSNLYCSLVLRPALAPAHAPQITLMAAVALADTIASFVADRRPAIKWPNDILIDGKKLAGILTESACDAKRIEFVILGMGVNLNFPRERMPETIRDRATSLTEVTGKTLSRELFVRRLIQDLDRCYGILGDLGFAAIAPRWEAYFALRGRRVRVEMVGEAINGTATGIDGDGALLLEAEDGVLHRVLAGDVIPLGD
jgi:BirA family biotin operon repressor/biotin-[acetyl-CoA-carboxylase] ligase